MEDRPLVLGQTCKATPLAFPKGRKKVCELCQSPARLQCAMSRVTFYCHAENQRADWVAIHERICKLFENQLSPDVRGPQSVHQAHAFLLLAEANIGEKPSQTDSSAQTIPNYFFFMICLSQVVRIFVFV
uniref:MYND-type domain-containing protein n=1 Tax=Oryzias latipes TaxID=8090 RepID=A0A3P9KZI4_ORYLA